MNPPKVLINSVGNLREIPRESTCEIPLNFHVDSCFTYNPNFPVDYPPENICHSWGFPAEYVWFCPLWCFSSGQLNIELIFDSCAIIIITAKLAAIIPKHQMWFLFDQFDQFDRFVPPFSSDFLMPLNENPSCLIWNLGNNDRSPPALTLISPNIMNYNHLPHHQDWIFTIFYLKIQNKVPPCPMA